MPSLATNYSRLPTACTASEYIYLYQCMNTETLGTIGDDDGCHVYFAGKPKPHGMFRLATGFDNLQESFCITLEQTLYTYIPWRLWVGVRELLVVQLPSVVAAFL